MFVKFDHTQRRYRGYMIALKILFSLESGLAFHPDKINTDYHAAGLVSLPDPGFSGYQDRIMENEIVR